MSRIVPIIVLSFAICLTAAGGVFHGRVYQRWGTSADTVVGAQKLQTFPKTFGHWQLQETLPLAQPVIDLLQCNGYINSRFINTETGEIVSVAVLLGPSGPISVHTPEICYSSREFRLVGDRQPVTIRDSAGRESVAWGVTFESTHLEKALMRVHYTWSYDGNWQAVENPRITFAGRPFLYKIQLAATLPPNADLAKNDPCRNFLVDFLPALNQHLFAQQSIPTTETK